MRGSNKFGELTLVGCDLDGNLMEGRRSYPTYTCGHCSKVVVIRPDRERPRTTCMACGGWICEKSEICNTHCTPLHALSHNGMDLDRPNSPHVKYLPAIMAGVESVNEAHRLGLVNP